MKKAARSGLMLVTVDQASPIASREALPPTAVVLMVRVFSVMKRLR